MNKFTASFLILSLIVISFYLGQSSSAQKQLVFSKDSFCSCKSTPGKLCYFNEVTIENDQALLPTTTDFDGKVIDGEVLIKCNGSVEFAAVKI